MELRSLSVAPRIVSVGDAVSEACRTRCWHGIIVDATRSHCCSRNFWSFSHYMLIYTVALERFRSLVSYKYRSAVRSAHVDSRTRSTSLRIIVFDVLAILECGKAHACPRNYRSSNLRWRRLRWHGHGNDGNVSTVAFRRGRASDLVDKWLQQRHRRGDRPYAQLHEAPDKVCVLEILVRGDKVIPHGPCLDRSTHDSKPTQTQCDDKRDFLESRHLHSEDDGHRPDSKNGIRDHVGQAVPHGKSLPDLDGYHFCIFLLIKMPIGPDGYT